MIKHSVFYVFLIWICVSTSAYSANRVHVPDSLEGRYGQLMKIEAKIRNLSSIIHSPADYKAMEVDLETVEGELKSVWEQLSEDGKDVLRDSYIGCMKLLRDIGDDVEAFRREEISDSLEDVMHCWSVRFDSLAEAGIGLEARKQGDSVASLKGTAGEWWQKVEALKESFAYAFGEGGRNAGYYSHIKERKEQISAFEEKKKVKVGDLLLKLLVAAGAIAMIGGMIGSRVRGRKMQKKAEEGTFFEL